MQSTGLVAMDSPGEENEQRELAVETLRGIVADLYVLVLKVRGMGWNLRGPRAGEVRLLFVRQGDTLARFRDTTAERIRRLGGTSPASLHEMMGLSSIEDGPGGAIAAHHAVAELEHDHGRLMAHLRRTAERARLDRPTVDFLEALVKVHEEMTWELQSVVR